MAMILALSWWDAIKVIECKLMSALNFRLKLLHLRIICEHRNNFNHSELNDCFSWFFTKKSMNRKKWRIIACDFRLETKLVIFSPLFCIAQKITWKKLTSHNSKLKFPTAIMLDLRPLRAILCHTKSNTMWSLGIVGDLTTDSSINVKLTSNRPTTTLAHSLLSTIFLAFVSRFELRQNQYFRWISRNARAKQ